MTIIFNFAGLINFRQLISTPYIFVCLFHQIMFYDQYLHYTTWISGITHYVSKYHSKSLYNVHRSLFWSKSFMELSPEFHGTFWTTFEQHLWFHGIPWNLSNKTPSSMESHGILSRSKVPWNSMGLFLKFHRISVEFHGTRWIWYLKKIIFLNIVVGIWLMIICYLAKISQKRYILHWFQYRNSYFKHPSVSENGMLLTHWGRDKMAAISQTTLSNAFSWMKMLEFRLKFHWSLFLRVQLTTFQRWFR